MRTLTITAFAVCLMLGNVISQDWMDYIPDEQKVNPNFFTIQKAFSEYSLFKNPTEIEGYKPYKRWEYFMQARVNKKGEFPNELYWNEIMKLGNERKLKNSKNVNWEPIGPFNIPHFLGINIRCGVGRVDCIGFHPTDENTFMVGTPAGGLWRTSDGGASWEPLTDQLPSLGISDIIYHPQNPDVVYIATGERDGWNTHSVGVLKSTDGGNTWEITGLSFEVPELRSVNKLLMDPSNPLTLFAASNLGIYKTIDGGSNWYQVIGTGHFRDLIFLYGDPSILLATTYNFFGGARIYRSIDGGENFEILNTGVPSSSTCRIALGSSPAEPNRIYALACSSYTFGLQGVYRTDDAGDNWNLAFSGSILDLVGYSAAGANQGGQGFYNLALAVDPVNPDEILVGGTHIWRSINGADSFTLNNNCYAPSADWIHADIHEFTYNPLNNVLYVGCDGGVYKSTDNGQNWIDISEGLQITQSYRMGISQTDPDLIVTGNQDNASFKYTTGTVNAMYGGDGMECFIDHSNNNVIFNSIQYGTLLRSLNGGINFAIITPDFVGQGAWTTPFLQHKLNPDVLYCAYQSVYHSEDKGLSWEQTSLPFSGSQLIHRLVVAPSDDDIIYAASYNKIWRSDDAGISWSCISNDLPMFSAMPFPFDLLTFYDMTVSPTDPYKFWVTYSNFMEENKVFKTNDGGDSWQNITANLPNLPVNCIVYQNGTEDGIYVGLDAGVFYTDNNLDVWCDVSNGLPNVIVTDLEINYQSNLLVAATHGRGVWKTELFDPLTTLYSNEFNSEISVYPNPASGHLNIDFTHPVFNQITIMDLNGRIINENHIHPISENIKINISDLPPGIYIAKFAGKDKIETLRFVKQ